ncbi:hypothetical protein CRG98_041460 [Punica granatum]|uniref:Uncharacterized protein n=1 Tax=Punica granatum TaxID=22663 RepID=A0A2I0I2P2_PUNGR|nr:hypothetical protein CRG98_041460 [Punica granatum]
MENSWKREVAEPSGLGCFSEPAMDLWAFRGPLNIATNGSRAPEPVMIGRRRLELEGVGSWELGAEFRGARAFG